MAANLRRKMNGSVSCPGSGAIYPLKLLTGLSFVASRQVCKCSSEQNDLLLAFGIWRYVCFCQKVGC